MSRVEGQSKNPVTSPSFGASTWFAPSNEYHQEEIVILGHIWYQTSQCTWLCQFRWAREDTILGCKSCNIMVLVARWAWGLRNRARGLGLGCPWPKVATEGHPARGPQAQWLGGPGWQPRVWGNFHCNWLVDTFGLLSIQISGPWVVSPCPCASFRDGLNQSSTMISYPFYNCPLSHSGTWQICQYYGIFIQC